jgi:hypothetical protein
MSTSTAKTGKHNFQHFTHGKIVAFCNQTKLSEGPKNDFMEYPQVSKVIQKTDFINVSSITCYSEHITSFWSIHKDMRCCDWSKHFRQACSVLETTFPPYYILCLERVITLMYAQWQYWQLLQIFQLITVCTPAKMDQLSISFLWQKKNGLFIHGIWLLV